VLTGLVFILFGCTRDMKDQPRYTPLQSSAFYADGRSSRDPVPGTVARGQLYDDDALYRGLNAEGSFVSQLPVELSAALLVRGQQRFDIFCSPCHSRVGDGRGMIVQRGFKAPTTFHDPRLRAVSVGYLFDVITSGFGQMSGYASQVSTQDRWAIVSYIRALQLSQYTPMADLSAAEVDMVRRGVVVGRDETTEDEAH